MRVLIVADSYYPFIGGVSRQIEGLAKAVVQAGHQAAIMAPSSNRHSHHEMKDGVELFWIASLPGPIIDGLRLAPPSFGQVDTIVQDWKPDVIHIQSELLLAKAASTSARRRHISYLFTSHNFTYNSKGTWWRWLDLLYRSYLNSLYSGQMVTVPAERTIEFLTKEYGPGHYRYLPNGIDATDFGQRQLSLQQAKQQLGLEDKTVFIYIGRLSPEKRIFDAINGIHVCSNPNIRYIIVGTGLQESELRKIVAKWGDVRISFTGKLQKDQLKAYYEAADAFIFPSPVENHSLAMMESLSYGLPILGANAGGIGATITDGKDGLLYPPFDPPAVTETIEKFIHLNPEQRLAMGKAAQQTVYPYQFDVLVQQYLDLYTDLIHQTAFPADHAVTKAATSVNPAPETV
jgi:glycosyltransferase involved in cell wall biosynthesis